MTKILSVCLWPLLLACVAAQLDETMVEMARGKLVVETCLKRIHHSCIFDDDKYFMRRVAYVETLDGTEGGTYRPGYYGGIWHLGERRFNSTKLASAVIIASVKAHFGIDWTKVVWRDLLKPLYSALAARIYLQFLNDAHSLPVPSYTSTQVTFWKNHYDPAGDLSNFLNRINQIPNLCEFAVDFAVMLDNSFNSPRAKWTLAKNNVRNMVPFLNIGSDYQSNSRFSLWQFSRLPTRQIEFWRYFNVAALRNAISNIPFSNVELRYIDLALNKLTFRGFLTSDGARGPVIPKYVLLLTNGFSSAPLKTQLEAQKLRDTGAIVYTLAIPPDVDATELQGIASKPNCTHFFKVGSYVSLLNFVNQMRQGFCLKPTAIVDGLSVDLVSHSVQYLSLVLSPNCSVLEISSASGVANVSLSFTHQPKPGSFDNVVTVTPNNTAFFSFNVTSGLVYVTVQAITNVSLTFNLIPSNCSCPANTEQTELIPDAYQCIPNQRDNGAFDCNRNNPCNPLVVPDKFHYPHSDANKYVQCGVQTCHVRMCPASLVWDDSSQTCNFPSNASGKPPGCTK